MISAYLRFILKIRMSPRYISIVTKPTIVHTAVLEDMPKAPNDATASAGRKSLYPPDQIRSKPTNDVALPPINLHIKHSK